MVVRRLRGDWCVGGHAFGGEVCIVREKIEESTVEGQGDLDLGLVGVAIYKGSAAWR